MSPFSIEDPKVFLAVLQIASQGGLAIVIFAMWLITFKRMEKQQQENLEQTRTAATLANGATDAAFKKNEELTAQVIQLLKDEQEYKILLTGIMERMDTRLSVPAQCPLLINGKKFKLEVTE